jgi:hypothetical protein
MGDGGWETRDLMGDGTKWVLMRMTMMEWSLAFVVVVHVVHGEEAFVVFEAYVLWL